MTAFEKFQRDALDMVALEAILFSTEKSRERKITDYQEIGKALTGYVNMLETWMNLTNQYVSKIPTLKADDSVHRALALEFVDKFKAVDRVRADELNNRKLAKAYLRNRKRWKDIADSKHPDVIAAEKALATKARDDYQHKLLPMVSEVRKLRDKIKAGLDAAKAKGEFYAMRSYGTAAGGLNAIIDELGFTMRDISTTLVISQRYGKFKFD